MPIDIEEFNNLEDVKERSGFTAKVPTEELLVFLGKQAYTAKEVAEFLQVQAVSANSRLKRLVEKGEVAKKFDGKKTFFTRAIKEGE